MSGDNRDVVAWLGVLLLRLVFGLARLSSAARAQAGQHQAPQAQGHVGTVTSRSTHTLDCLGPPPTLADLEAHIKDCDQKLKAVDGDPEMADAILDLRLAYMAAAHEV
jgi:hypothetical protein